jgi:hypothetical protein
MNFPANPDIRTLEEQRPWTGNLSRLQIEKSFCANDIRLILFVIIVFSHIPKCHISHNLTRIFCA